jgi:hypothetical protein
LRFAEQLERNPRCDLDWSWDRVDRRTAETCSGSVGQITTQRKAARRRLSISNLMIVDQAAINTGFDFRRYAMKPMPAKPRIIIAHVEGSGTADTEGEFSGVMSVIKCFATDYGVA